MTHATSQDEVASTQRLTGSEVGLEGAMNHFFKFRDTSPAEAAGCSMGCAVNVPADAAERAAGVNGCVPCRE